MREAQPYACVMAELGDIRAAVNKYAHGGAFSWSNKQRRKARKAELNAGKAGRNRNRAHGGVAASVFYTAYRRFYLPTQ